LSGSPGRLALPCLILLWLSAGAAAPPPYRSQEIRIPTAAKSWHFWPPSGFADIDHKGRYDLLAVGWVENRLWIYRQQASGFPGTPDQALELPAQTAWIAPRDVAPAPGDELLFSTATGLVYLEQAGGLFDPRPHRLIAASQVFTADTPPVLALRTNLIDAANTTIPVITADQVVPYQRTRGGQWHPASPLALKPTQAQWLTLQQDWTFAGRPSYHAQLRQVFRTHSETNQQKKAEHPTLAKFIEETKKEPPWQLHGLEYEDLDGDGREDVAAWQCSGDLNITTQIIMFLRGADGHLPEPPTQVLRCRGLPVAHGPRQELSPICDLDGNGTRELVLMAPKTTITSWSSLVDMAVSRGVDWALTIRTLRGGAYAHSPDASLEISTALPEERGFQDLLWIEGDFNGDGRRDVLVKRSAREWNVFLSAAGGRWFDRKPGLTFEIPFEGLFDIRDLNQDGISDLVAAPWEEPRLLIFLSQGKGRGP
jgi:hypothetical protein